MTQASGDDRDPAGQAPASADPGGGPFAVGACGPGQRAEQAELFNACFKKEVDASALAWRYDRGPQGGSVSFVTRNAEGLAVSGYACSPRRMLHRGDERTLASVGETGDVMTHPEWRKRGLFSDLDRAALAETKRLGWPMVFGLPNRRSAHIFLKLGWEQIGCVRPYTFVLKADAASRQVRKREGRAAALMTGIGARKGRRARAVLGEAQGDFDVRELERFPEQVGALSRAIEPCYGVMVRRDADYLNWRFADSPAGLHRRVGLFDASGELAAYVVVQVPREGPHGGYLVDLLGRDERAVQGALAAGLSALERSGASYVEATAMDGTWWAERLLGAGFLAPKPDNHLIVILFVHDPEHPLVAAAREPKRWYFTDGDRDDETMG